VAAEVAVGEPHHPVGAVELGVCRQRPRRLGQRLLEFLLAHELFGPTGDLERRRFVLRERRHRHGENRRQRHEAGNEQAMATVRRTLKMEPTGEGEKRRRIAADVPNAHRTSFSAETQRSTLTAWSSF